MGAADHPPRSLTGLAHVGELELRAGAVRSHLEASEGAVAIDDLVARVLAGDGDATDALVACALVIARDAVLAGTLASSAAPETWARAMLLDRAPGRALLPRGQLPDPRGATGPLSLLLHEDFGPTHVLRRTGDEPRLPLALRIQRRAHVMPNVLARVVTEPVLTHRDPALVDRFLASTHARVEHVVRLAARRPTTPALLATVATSARWIGHRDVREALVKNPFAATRTVLLYLPTVRRTVWHELAGISRVHPRVRDLARGLLAGAPPR